MANGSEVTKKVKDAIKAKLLELGAYVDDELPDYIMVLVANKKTKDQMDEDLSLFLGHNTERFTSWLHEVLHKLNAASFFKETTPTETVTEEKKNDAIVMKERLELKKEKSEKRKEKKEKKKKKKEKKEKSRKKEKQVDVLKTEQKENGVQSNIIKLNKEPEIEPPVSSEPCKIGTDILEIQTSPQDLNIESDEDQPSVVEAPPKNIKRTIHQVVSSTDENVSENKKSNEKKISVHARLGPQNLEKKTEHLKEEVSLSLKSTIEVKSGIGRVLTNSIASAVRSVSQTDKSGKVSTKLEARVKPLMKERIKRHISDDDDKDLNEEVPVKKSQKLTSVVRPVVNMESTKTVSIPSKVEVTGRPRRVGSGHANTALILRAVADAHKSVNRPSKRIAEEEPESLSKKKKIFSKAYQEQMDEPKVRKIAITVPNAHVPSPSAEDDNSVEEFSEEESIEEALPESPELKDTNHRLLPSPNQSTRFVVTMDGTAERNVKGRLGTRRSSVDDEYIEEVEEWEEVEEATLPETASAEHIKKQETPLIAVTKKEGNCKYWPDCKEGDCCRFIHANKTTTCINFPNCKFGKKCLYSHPQCKFDATCTKVNCPFSHTAKPAISALSNPALKVKCKYFPKCTDMNCPFVHPKQVCRYGNFCKVVNCFYIHPEVVYGSKLKWIAPKPADKPITKEPVEV